MDGSMFEAPAGGGEEAAPAKDTEAAAGNAAAEGSQAAVEPSGSKEGGEGSERPDWLLPKYNSVEDQAKAYRDLYGRFSKKTDDLKAEVRDQAVSEYVQSLGVPETPDGYEMPEGIEISPEGEDALKTWAHEHKVSPKALVSLVDEIGGLRKASFEAEFSKLGEHASERIGEVNRWVAANVDKSQFGVVEKIMTTADGVQFIESLMGANRGFAPGEGRTGEKLTREGIRALQADERFGTDPAYTQMVRDKWTAFGRMQQK